MYPCSSYYFFPSGCVCSFSKTSLQRFVNVLFQQFRLIQHKIVLIVCYSKSLIIIVIQMSRGSIHGITIALVTAAFSTFRALALINHVPCQVKSQKLKKKPINFGDNHIIIQLLVWKIPPINCKITLPEHQISHLALPAMPGVHDIRFAIDTTVLVSCVY